MIRVMVHEKYSKLNLGSGTVLDHQFPLPWLNVDIEANDSGYRCDVISLPTDWTERFREVRASHVLEHIFLEDWDAALAEWVRVLAPHGVIRIIVPDLEIVVRDLVRGFDDKGRSALSTIETTPVLAQIYGAGYGSRQTEERWRHRIIVSKQMLGEAMLRRGLTDIRVYNRLDDPAASLGIRDDSQNMFSLRMLAIKE